jgi:WD40 repeat protein
MKRRKQQHNNTLQGSPPIYTGARCTLSPREGVYLNTLALTTDGRTLFYTPVGNKTTVTQWDLTQGLYVKTLTGHTSYVKVLVVSADGRRLFGGLWNHTIAQWDVTRGVCVRTLYGHQEWVCTLLLSADGHTLFSGAADYKVKQWDLRKGVCMRTFLGHTNWVNSLALSPHGHTLFSGSYDGTVKLWDLTDPSIHMETARPFEVCPDTQINWRTRTLTEQSSTVSAMVLSADGLTLFTGSDDQTVKQWDLLQGRCMRTFVGHKDVVTVLALSVDGRTLFSGSWDNTVKQWDVLGGVCVRTFQDHIDRVISLVWSAQGGALYAASRTGGLYTYQLLHTTDLVTATRDRFPPDILSLIIQLL